MLRKRILKYQPFEFGIFFVKNHFFFGNKNFAFLFPIFLKEGGLFFLRRKNQHFLIREKTIILCKIIGIIWWKFLLCLIAAIIQGDLYFIPTVCSLYHIMQNNCYFVVKKIIWIDIARFSLTNEMGAGQTTCSFFVLRLVWQGKV